MIVKGAFWLPAGKSGDLNYLRGVISGHFFAPKHNDVKAGISVIGKSKVQLFDEVN